MVDGVDSNQLYDLSRQTDGKGQRRHPANFLGDPNGEDGEQAAQLVGYVAAARVDPGQVRRFPSRQPDLLGEYMVLWSLGAFDANRWAQTKGLPGFQIWSLLPSPSIRPTSSASSTASGRISRRTWSRSASCRHPGRPTGWQPPWKQIRLASRSGRSWTAQGSRTSSDAHSHCSTPVPPPAPNRSERPRGLCHPPPAEGRRPERCRPAGLGNFPLLLAAQNGHDACVEHLLAKGADPNKKHEHRSLSPSAGRAERPRRFS